MHRFLALEILIAATPCAAQEVGSDDATFRDGIMVTSSDVTTCPYRFIQPVSVSSTEDYGISNRAKIFDKLRDQAKTVAADAVVMVQKGGSHMTAFAFSRRTYAGRAIRYVDRTCAPTGAR